MGKKKLLLINPFNSNRMGVGMKPRYRFQPLGLGIIAGLTPDDWEVALIDENFEPFKYQEADLVGLTAFTVNACRAYEIANFYRRNGISTVMGGIHASMLPEEALRYVNTVVIGEGEGVWPKVIADFTAGQMQRIYQGEWQDLKGLIWPRRDLFHRKYVFGSIQTSRGCPMDCEFCSVSAFNGRRYRQRPVVEVLDEMETIPQKFLFFVDDNIIGYGKGAEERAIELFEGMIRRKIRKQCFCQASMNIADNEEVLECAAKAGCRIFLIGVEAEDTDALEELGKKLNLKIGVGAYEEAFQRINRHGIAVLGTFMAGMDVDTPERLRYRADYGLRSRGINAIEASYLTPFPGTRLFNKLWDEGRLLYTKFPEDWNRYDLSEVVYKPALMTPEELSAIGSEIAQRICSGRSVWRKFFRNWRTTRSLIAAMWAHQVNIAYRNAALSAISSNRKENE